MATGKRKRGRPPLQPGRKARAVFVQLSADDAELLKRLADDRTVAVSYLARLYIQSGLSAATRTS